MKVQKNGSTLIVKIKEGQNIRVSGFRWISKDTMVSDSFWGTRVNLSDGLCDYTFGRIKTIVVVKVPN